MLQTELGDDPLAPTYILRLWGHCQEQKTHRFPKLSAGALAAICCFKTSPEMLWLAMQTAGFILVKNTTVEVHQWDEYNAGLITSWNNGKKGGRPKKPASNPRDTHGQPKANPDVTDREDGIDKIEKRENGSPPSQKEWLGNLSERHPEINVSAEFQKWKKKCHDKDRDHFEDRWLPNSPKTIRPKPNPSPLADAPAGWKEVLDELIPGNSYQGSWGTLDLVTREKILTHKVK